MTLRRVARHELVGTGLAPLGVNCKHHRAAARKRLKGQFAVTDGPFTEAMEVVGGLAILQAPSREAAIEYVKEFIKVAGDGECELRQLWEMPPQK